MEIDAPELLQIKAELESILAKLDQTLTVQDTDVKDEVEAVKTRLDGVLNVKADDTDTELANLKQELIDIKTNLGAIEDKLNEQVIEDGAALTKLTGSNVVLSTTGGEVAPSTITTITINNVYKYKSLGIGINTNLTNDTNWQVSAVFNVLGTSFNSPGYSLDVVTKPYLQEF